MSALVPYIEFEISNNGNGPLQGIWAENELFLHGASESDDLSGGEMYLEPAIAQGIIEFPERIEAGESVRQPIQFTLKVNDDERGEGVTNTADSIVQALSEYGVNSISIRFVIGGRDTFGKERDAVSGPYRGSYMMHISIDDDQYSDVVRGVQEYIDHNSNARQRFVPRD